MAFDQNHCMDTLTAATEAGADTSEFPYAFLDAYSFPKATITRARNGGARNVSGRADEGHVAINNWLYFMPVKAGESIHEALAALADEDTPAQHRCRFLVVTDYNEITALDTKGDERMEAQFSELASQYLFFAPMAGLERTQQFSESSVDLKAASKMGRLFDRLKDSNEISTPEQIHALNTFLTRLLFCYFAEDTGIFPDDAFTKVINDASDERGGGLSELIAQLFTVMDTPRDQRQPNLPDHISQFPFVNGGLFADDLPVPEIGGKARRMMIECGQLRWEAVNPDIFGSMFQAVVDEESRDALGQHYTSVPNIMKVIRPLFLDPLDRALNAAKGNRKKLEALLVRLSRIKVFDPAMGSGNFLIIAYKELRRVEMATFRALQALGGQQEMFMSGITIGQLYGIEIDDFAHETAQLSLWLAEHQMNTQFADEFGHAEPLLPLKDTTNLVQGNSLRMDWTAVCPNHGEAEVYVCGNPPFVGHGNRSDSQLEDMRHVLEEYVRTYKSLDYVACWFLLAAQYGHRNKTDTAFVATNSICQGKQAGLLWPALLDMSVKISFGYQAFPWSNSALGKAGVHVVIVGLTRHDAPRTLFSHIDGEWRRKDVDNISPYLLEGDDTVVKERRQPVVAGTQPMLYGSMPNDGGYLLLTPDEKDRLIAAEPQAAPWIKKLVGAQEFLQGRERWCLWLADASQADLDAMPLVSKRVKEVYKARLNSSRASTQRRAEAPHEFGENRHPKEGTYILVPILGSERRSYAPIGFFDNNVIATNLANIIPGGTLYDLAVLSSIMHMDWMRLVGSRMKSDYRYSATLVYNTFAWPEAGERQRQAIERLGGEVLMARAGHPGSTMAELYDPDKMPANLRDAHQALDRAVEKLYRDTPFRTAAERQEYLLARYETLIEAERKAAVGGKRRTKKES